MLFKTETFFGAYFITNSFLAVSHNCECWWGFWTPWIGKHQGVWFGFMLVGIFFPPLVYKFFYLNYEPFQSSILTRMIHGWVCLSYYLPLPLLHKTTINKLIPSCLMCYFYATKCVAHIPTQENIQKSY
jgi:hypothetical protein